MVLNIKPSNFSKIQIVVRKPLKMYCNKKNQYFTKHFFSYQCNNGYFLDGQATTTCEDDQDNDADGVWSSEPPTCVRITCIPPHVGPSNGVVVCSDSNFNNSMCL